MRTAPHTPPTILALCRELPAPAESAAGADAAAVPPEWLLLVPAGEFLGRDGRPYLNDRPAAIVDEFRANRADIPFDIEHATVHQAPQGLPAPAQAWIDQMEVRDGAVWGHVAWEAQGVALWANRAYRYYSPAYLILKGSTRVVGIHHVGLTNKPNIFETTALNQQEAPVDLTKLAAALGLDPAADLTAILAAIDALKAKAAGGETEGNCAAGLNAWVPRADYDLMTNRVAALEQCLAGDHAAAVQAALDLALNQARIAPASVEYYRGQCATAEGLAAFQRFVGTAPAIVTNSHQGDVSGRKDGGTTVALNAQQRQIARALGISEEAYLATLKADQSELAQ